MPISFLKRLDVGEAKPTSIILHMIDRSIKQPWRVIDIVLVKVDNFIFLTNFILLDMEENREILIVLGLPFLETE